MYICRTTTFILVIGWSVLTEVGAKLIVVPEDIVASGGSSVRLNCSTDLHGISVTWKFTAVGFAASVLVFYTEYVDSQYESEYKIDSNGSGQYNLIINTFQSKHAGRYSCYDDAGFGEEMSAELIYIESDLHCSSDSPSWTSNNPCGLEVEDIKISCRIQFTGSYSPTMSWYSYTDGLAIPINSGVRTSSTLQGSVSEITSQLAIPAEPIMNGRTIQCVTKIQSDTSELYRYEWKSEFLQILYIATRTASNMSCPVAPVNCPVIESSLQCDYMWNNVENNSVLDHTELLDDDLKSANYEYQCTASCKLRTNLCNVTVTAVSCKESANSVWWIAGVVVPIVVIVTIIIIIVIVLMRKFCKTRHTQNYVPANTTPPSLPIEHDMRPVSPLTDTIK